MGKLCIKRGRSADATQNFEAALAYTDSEIETVEIMAELVLLKIHDRDFYGAYYTL